MEEIKYICGFLIRPEPVPESESESESEFEEAEAEARADGLLSFFKHWYIKPPARGKSV